MTTYKGIHGYSVQSLASDPTAEDTVGQLWYNSASNVWKVSTEGSGAWSTGGDTNDIYCHAGYLGIQTACLSSGGSVNGVTSVVISESYNGTAWSETNDLPAARYGPAGFGTMAAGVSTGGRTADNAVQNSTAEWDGTNWTLVPGTLNVSRGTVHGAGTQTAGIIAGGVEPTNSSAVETYDGTTWSSITNMPSAKSSAVSIGTTTAFMAVSGVVPPTGSKVNQQWDGSAWTEGNDLNVARGESCGSGTNTAAMIMAGQSGPGEPVTAYVEQWDGNSWAAVTAVATARKSDPGSGQSGTTSASIIWGGFTSPSPPCTPATEEWTSPIFAIKTVTTS